MASLKEVKTRIASVGTTRKITQARQMVASAQLHHMQGVLENTKQYKLALDQILAGLSGSPGWDELPLVGHQPTGAVAVVILSSDSGMCGAFNANMIKLLDNIRVYYPDEDLLFFPIGKKIREAVERAGHAIGWPEGLDGSQLSGKYTDKEVTELLSLLIDLFRNKQIKQADLIYYQYKSMAIQEIKEVTLLPFTTTLASRVAANEDYIYEPGREELIDALIPMALRAQLHYALAENQTSEHAARTMAMQLATENADEILAELQLTYNKLRQQNITTELLDIIGSSFA
ncbi:ATP synthase F1 subunit gamma [Parabacteroides sp. PF5-6]|uniref:ATP synthase F1 subunit gamma n=1 Tax=Parabacteroides sp. PF5-6 TaxID=1742403 RepID=UPI0024073B28|nr:ATP synthase F1 subunit gamma [Parabacteroides sp. PF5-6]MDF9828756.1 F-type H+-transporting ATPase subunit gamma [Parabacteroides sp. PF5-6]